MAITVPTGFPIAANVAGKTTQAISPVNIGDYIGVIIKVSSATVYASSLSGGGVTTWIPVGTFPNLDATDSITLVMFWGVVTATGAQTITATFSASNAALSTEFAVISFNSALSATAWSTQTPVALLSTAVTNVPFPSITSGGGALQAYWGYARSSAGTVTAGATSGFTYYITPAVNVVPYNPALATTTAYAPTAANGTSNNVYALASIVTASTPVVPDISMAPQRN